MKTPAFLFGFKVKHGFSVSMAFGGCLPTSQIELILMGLLPFGIRSLDPPYGENMLCLDYNT